MGYLPYRFKEHLVWDFMLTNNLKVEDFCFKCSITIQQFYKITSQNEDFEVSTLFRIAKVMDLSICELFYDYYKCRSYKPGQITIF